MPKTYISLYVLVNYLIHIVGSLVTTIVTHYLKKKLKVYFQWFLHIIILVPTVYSNYFVCLEHLKDIMLIVMLLLATLFTKF